MLYKTHAAVTYAIALPILAANHSLTLGNLFAVGIGSLLPDIDHPRSYVGARTRGLSDGVRKVFGHRGLAHSIVGILFFSVLTQFILTLFNWPLEWGDWLIFGYVAHLIEDSFSKPGISWLQLFSNKRIQFGFNILYYRTGSFTETVLFVLACAVNVYHIIDFNILQQLTRQLV